MDQAQIKKSNWVGYGIAVLLLHIIALGCLLSANTENGAILGLGFLAYTLGLRHAFDADHIAAIDNTVRKLLQQEKNPMGVGFYFSLGHSTVVILMAMGTAFAAQWATTVVPEFKDVGSLISTSVSGVFLILIGLLNLVVLLDIFKIFKDMRQDSYNEEQLEDSLQNRGFMSRFLKPLFKFVNKSWHVYPIGF